MKTSTVIAWTALALVVVLPSCSTIDANADGIAIRHSAENNLGIERRAEDHCNQFGKQALKVQRTPVETKYLVQTVVTRFACVPKS